MEMEIPEIERSTYIEGFGDDAVVVISLLVLFLLFLVLSYLLPTSSSKYPAPTPTLQPVQGPHSETCPICLDTISYPVKTNCGHLYCGACVLQVWDNESWLMSPMKCPMCRQAITLIFFHLDRTEAQNVVNEQPTLLRKVNEYNKRFSGAPRPWMDYIYDIPTLVRQMWSDSGLSLLMRFRIYMYFALAIAYVLVPVDLLPESAFGVAGMVDDLVVLIIVALYVTNTYRTYVAYRNIQPLLDHINGPGN